jgi:hypothetical protein
MTTTSELEAPGPSDVQDRAPRIVFWVLIVLAFPVIMRIGSYHWFLRDEWSFLSGRSITSVDDLFRPHALSHWSTVPIVIYRLLWFVFGARTYLPYQALVVVMHLAVAVLLRQLMRRAGVDPWVATIAAAPFILFGPGDQNIVWAFQIGFTGSIAFGLTQLLLATHDGPFDWRDWLGLGAGLLALMSSGVGVTMAVIVGVATLLLRGWRVAAFHTAPLAAAYGLWTVIEDPITDARGFGRPSVRVLAEWVDSFARGTFSALGHYQVVSLLMVTVLVVGLAVAWREERGARLAIPVALLVGVVVFSMTVAQGRWPYGPGFARASRYLYLGAALVVPALGVAIDALWKRWRFLWPALLVLLLVPVPANARAFDNDSVFNGRYFDEEQRILTTVVRMPFARQVPSDVRPIPDIYLSRTLDIGFLLDARRSGRLDPSTDPLSGRDVNEMKVRLGVAQRSNDARSKTCATRGSALELRPEQGSTYVLTTPVQVETLNEAGGASSRKVTFRPVDGNELTIELSGLALRVDALRGQAGFGLCEVRTS